MDKKFCPQCGKQIPVDSAFCPECGANVAAVALKSPVDGGNGKTKKGLSKGALIGIIAGGVALIAAAVVLIIVLGGKKNAANFDVTFTKSGVEAFLGKVCRNIDAESAKVVSVEERETEESGLKYMDVTLEIKLKGEDSQNITVYFDKDNDSNRVEAVFIPYDDANRAEYACNRAFIQGLEKTLGGGKAGQSLKSAEEMFSERTEIVEGCWISDTIREELDVMSVLVENDSAVAVSGYCCLVRDNKITVSSRKNALIGTWTGYDSDGDRVTYSFEADGSGQDGDYSWDYFQYEVDDDNIMHWETYYGYNYVYFYSKAAMDDDGDCWYIDGDTLYIDGYQLIKQD